MMTRDPRRAMAPRTKAGRVQNPEASSSMEHSMVLLKPHELLRKLPKQLEFTWLQVTENLTTGGLSVKELRSCVTGSLEIGILELFYTVANGHHLVPVFCPPLPALVGQFSFLGLALQGQKMAASAPGFVSSHRYVQKPDGGWVLSLCNFTKRKAFHKHSRPLLMSC